MCLFGPQFYLKPVFTMPFPILEDKIKVLPHSCFVCSKAFVRKNTLLKHYQEHPKELGPNLEHFEEAKKEFLRKKLKLSSESEPAKTDQVEYSGFYSVVQQNLPYNCVICSKPFVRENTLLKHYHEHSDILGPNFENLGKATADYLNKQKTIKIQYYGFQEECVVPVTNTVEQNDDQNVIQNLDSNDIIVTSVPSLDSNDVMVQNLDPNNIVQHINPSSVTNLNPEDAFAMEILPERETHECPVCSASFSELSSLRRHSLIHITDKTFACDVCKESFPTKNELDSHYAIHCSVQSFECWDCNKTFSTEFAFENHKFQEGHFTDAKHFCEECKIGFSTDRKYKEHCNIHVKKKKETCELCNKEFSKFIDLKKHFLLHAGEEPHVCLICGSRFFQKHFLNMHCLKQHFREMKFVCYICIKSFTSEEDLKEHNLTHRLFSCSICHKTFIQKSHFDVHNLTYHPKKESFSCKVCSAKFQTKSELLNHKHEHTKKKIYVCNFCSNAFSDKDDFEEHKKLHEINLVKRHSSGKKRKLKEDVEDVKKKQIKKKSSVICDICAESIDCDEFEGHMLIHNKGCMHTCRVCSESFTFKEDLEAHSKSVHEGGKPFSCNICKESFAFKSDLRQHKQIHTVKKSFPCKHCHENFAEKSELIGHIKVSCKKNSKNSCLTCGKKFRTKIALRTHNKTHKKTEPKKTATKASNVDFESEEFVCKFCNCGFSSKAERSAHIVSCVKKGSHPCRNCNERFYSKEELLDHKKIHSRRQPFICKVCNEGFKLKEALEKHKKIHNVNPTYPCNICDKIFTQKDALKEHKLSHQDEIVYICRVCDSTFENKDAFKAHRETHDVITHQCKVCSDIFNSRKELKRHYLKHILERPNLCRICNATFEQWGALRSHYLSHTRN